MNGADHGPEAASHKRTGGKKEQELAGARSSRQEVRPMEDKEERLREREAGAKARGADDGLKGADHCPEAASHKRSGERNRSNEQ